MMLAALLVALSPGALPNGPTASDVARAMELAQDCEGVELTEVLSQVELKRLQLDRDSARHASTLDATELYWGDAVLLKRWRTQAAPPSLAQIYRDYCVRFPHPLAAVGVHLQAGHAAVHQDRAWVPLLTTDGDYFGLGLGFVREDGRWRWTEQIELGRHVQIRHPRNEHLWRAIRAQPIPTYACEDDRLPPPPEPQDLDLESVDSALGEQTEDTDNIWGYLQRQAIRYYAGARIGSAAVSSAPPSPSAMALWAQTLYATLDFEDAPEIGSPLWDSRMGTAMNYAQRAIGSGANPQDFAPLSIAVAQRLMFHDEQPQSEAAAVALQAALAAGEPQAHMLHALLLASGGSGSAQPDCNAAVLGLLDAARRISSDEEGFARGDLLILAAQIDLACDQPAERRPARALNALQSLPTERQQDHQELIAYASCMAQARAQTAQESPPCSVSESLGMASVWTNFADSYDSLPHMSPATDPQAPEVPDCP